MGNNGCPATTESKGEEVGCIKPPDHDGSHWGRTKTGKDVAWPEVTIPGVGK